MTGEIRCDSQVKSVTGNGNIGVRGATSRQGRQEREEVGAEEGCDCLVGCDKDVSVTGTARCDIGGRVVEGGKGPIVCKKWRWVACDGRLRRE